MDKLKTGAITVLLSIVGFFGYQYAVKIDKIADKVDIVAENTQYMKAKIETIEKRQDRIETKGSSAKNECIPSKNKKDTVIESNTVHFFKNEPTYQVAIASK